MPGTQPCAARIATHHEDASSLLLGADEVRQAAAGRQSRTAEHRPSVDEMRREQLTRGSEWPERDEPDERTRRSRHDGLLSASLARRRAVSRRRGGRPIRLLAVSDEVDPSPWSPRRRGRCWQPVDLIIGCGDLEPSYLGFLGRRVRRAAGLRPRQPRRRTRLASGASTSLPDPLRDGRIHDEEGLRLLPFSGSPQYAPHGQAGGRAAGLGRRHVVRAWPGPGRAPCCSRPLVVMTHAAPRGLNDAPDHAHRGFTVVPLAAGPAAAAALAARAHRAGAAGDRRPDCAPQWHAAGERDRRDADRAHAAGACYRLSRCPSRSLATPWWPLPASSPC